ncbi:MAG TPA: hypothetical protein PK668_25160 [Myxococcota bacterium]|nr:hypothetical protein [Myxococcota bacterium]HRY95288.1 hypothetical protein [Myxococcota bacterium]
MPRFVKYLKKAFLQHWNVLALAAGTALGFVSGHPDVVLPLVAAGELIYLTGLTTHPRFQSAVDAEEHKLTRAQTSEETSKKAEAILTSLGRRDREKYDKLRTLCGELRRISQGFREQAETGAMEDMRTSNINRLLWIYLKLLYSKNALEQFFATIDQDEISETHDRARERLEAMGPAQEQDTPEVAKRRKTLQDTLTTTEARLANYERAKQKHEFFELELDRVYSTIAGLGEMSISRQDPEFITQEVDSVSVSVQQTEKAMGELEMLTGLTSGQEETPPALLDQQTTPGADS